MTKSKSKSKSGYKQSESVRDRVRGKHYRHSERARIEARRLVGVGDWSLKRALHEVRNCERVAVELGEGWEVVADLLGVESRVGSVRQMFKLTRAAIEWELFRRGLYDDALVSGGYGMRVSESVGLSVACAGVSLAPVQKEICALIRSGVKIRIRLPRDGTYCYESGAPLDNRGMWNKSVRALISKGYAEVDESGTVILRGKAASGDLWGQRKVGRRSK